MTTKTHKHTRPRHSGPPGRSFMESLGFAETPTVSYVAPPTSSKPAPSRLVSTGVGRAITVEQMWDTTELHAESMVDWAPVAVDKRKLNKRLRFKVIAIWLLILGTLGVGGFWLWQAPSASADRAIAEVTADAESLETALAPMLTATEALTPEFEEITLALADAAATVDETSRELFAAAASLPDSELELRSNATDSATAAINASKQLTTTAAYLGAVVPIMTGPALETDPDLVELADAAAQFAAWQSHFDSVRGVLPVAVMTAVSRELETISADLGSIQSNYLDAVREGDRESALETIRSLEGRLSNAWSLLLTETETARASIIEIIVSAQTSLDLVAG